MMGEGLRRFVPDGDAIYVVAVLAFVALAIVQIVHLNPCASEVDRAGCEEFIRRKEPYEAVTLGTRAYYVSSRDGGVKWLTQAGSAIVLSATAPTPNTLTAAPMITVFVHGFRGVESVVATYFGDMVSFLASNDRFAGSMVVYDWASTARDWLAISPYERKLFIQPAEMVLPPTTLPMGYVAVSRNAFYGGYAPRYPDLHYRLAWEEAQYTHDQVVAAGDGSTSLILLLDELRKLNATARINLIGHSMGCYVIERALQQRPDVARTLDTIVWLAPDVAYDALNDPGLATTLTKVSRLHIFLSREDGVLKWPSRIQNGIPRLGAVGPKGDVPSTVVVHDVTREIARLGRPPTPGPDEEETTILGDIAAHTAFLLTESGVPGMILELLREE